MFHGLVLAEILKEYCDQHSITEFIIPDIMTNDHPHRERSGRVMLQRRIFKVKTMREDSRMNKYNPRNPNRRAVEKRAAENEAHHTKRAKKLDVTFAANPFLSAYKSYGINEIDSLVVGHFGEVNKGFKQLICCEGGCRFTRSRKHNSCKLYGSQKERCLRFIQEKVQNYARLYGDKESEGTNDSSGIRRKKEAATHVACAGNTRGYHSEYGNSWFNNRGKTIQMNDLYLIRKVC